MRLASPGTVRHLGPWLATIFLATTAALALPVAATAQRPPIQATPLPPLQQQWQQEGLPPVQEAPAAPGAPDQGPDLSGQGGQAPDSHGQDSQATDNSAQGAPAQPPTPVDRPNIWLPAKTVKLQALDKVNAETTALTIKVGQSATFGSLTITAKACMTRPTDQPADAAAYLAVTDAHPDSPGFTGWMLADEPAVSMMQHPVYDLRVTGCT